MDIRNEMGLQFLDLHDLTDNDKRHIITILKADATEALKLPWDAKDIEGNNNNVNSVTVTEVPELQQHHWYNAIPPPTYPQQMMTQMCNEWQAPMYNVPANGHMPPFMAYAHPGYNISTEIQEMNYNRENGRRNNRGRGGIRRDNYNRTINPANEMQSGYMGDQAQYHPQIPIMYIYPDHSVSTQQHQVATGQIYYTQPMYSTIPHPHPNAQSISSNSHTVHPTYSQTPNPQAPQVNRCVRQSQSVPPQQPSQEPAKQPVVKSHDKQIQSTSDKLTQQVNETNSSPSNVVSTVIVTNPTSEASVKNVNENTANRQNVTSSEKVDSKLQHNISWAVNENCNGTEKVMPCVNTNNDVKENQNNESDKKFTNETVPNITTNAVKTSPKPISIRIDKSEAQIEENVALKDTEDKTISKTPNGSPSMPNGSSTTPNTSPSSTSETSPATTISRSYASLFRKDSTLETPTATASTLNCNTSCKPTEHVAHQNESPKMPVQKEPTSPICTPESQNDSSSAPTLQNGILQNCYDDPNTYRMGEFLSSYQMDKQTVSLLPRGLTNRSNYCYINSILQALLACPPFYNLLTALPLPKNRGRNSATPLIDNMVKFVREFSPLTEAARMPRKDRVHKRGEDTVMDIYSGIAFEPSYVYTMLKNASAAGAFSVEGRQEDAEEFLSCLLNGINDEMLELIKLVSNDQNAISNAKNVSNEHDEEEWQVMGPKNKGAVTRCTEFERTPLSDIFRGQLRSRVSRAGEQPTDNVQPFFTLQLDVQKAESVRHALEILVGKDQVEGLTCSKTRQQIEAWKQVTLEELPVILILHLKWFVYKFDKFSNGCSKILKTVEFPIDLKIDGKFLSPNTVKKLGPKQKQYKLFAVTYHDGKEATKGHYFTDAFHVGYGSWVRYDDSTVKSVPESNVLRPTSPRVPYLLYYRRCDTIGNNQSNSAKAH